MQSGCKFLRFSLSLYLCDIGKKSDGAIRWNILHNKDTEAEEDAYVLCVSFTWDTDKGSVTQKLAWKLKRSFQFITAFSLILVVLDIHAFTKLTADHGDIIKKKSDNHKALKETSF